MTTQKLANTIAKLEGKKVETPIGGVREVLKKLCELLAFEMLESDSPIEQTTIFGALKVDAEKKLAKLKPKVKK
jgi:hypothetical protein